VNCRLLLVIIAVGQLTAQNGAVAGRVLDGRGIGVAMAEVKVWPSPDPAHTQYATTGEDGNFNVAALAPGVYDLRATSLGFKSVELRGLRIAASVRFVIPSLTMEVGLIADCDDDVRPSYFTVSLGKREAGAIAGVVVGNAAGVVSGATVRLFQKGKGVIGSAMTRSDGRFSFPSVEVGSAEYWLSVAAANHFDEELRRVVVLPGLESVYPRIVMEPCRVGHCQPHLKTLRVNHGCA